MAPGVRLLQHRSTAQHGRLVARSRNLPWGAADGRAAAGHSPAQPTCPIGGHGAGGERRPLIVFTTKPIPAPMPPQINPPTAHNGAAPGPPESSAATTMPTMQPANAPATTPMSIGLPPCRAGFGSSGAGAVGSCNVQTSTLADSGRPLNVRLNYYAVPTSAQAPRGFVRRLEWIWLTTLRRRSQKTRMTIVHVRRLAAIYWPPVRVRHPWPDTRFAVNHPR